MGVSKFVQKNMRGEYGGALVTPDSDGGLSFTLPSTATSNVNIWFFPASGYSFENKGGSKNDSVDVHFGSVYTDIVTLYGDGSNSLTATLGITLKWDSTYTKNEQDGAYLLSVEAAAFNDSYWTGNRANNTMRFQLAQAPIEPATYTVVYDLSNCTVSPQPSSVEDGTSYTMTFEPNSGYEFDKQPSVSWYDSTGIYKSFDAVGGVVTFVPKDVNERVTVRASAIKTTPITEGYGIVNVYDVNDDNLTTIAQYGTSSGSEVNLTQYIASLRRFFVPVETEGTIRLVLGGYDTEDSVPQVTKDILEFDCGSIEVKGLYSNALDYSATSVEFWLPFVGTVDVETARVMDSMVSLAYRVNVLSGDCLAILSVDGLPVASSAGNCSYEVPYNSQDNYNISSALAVSAQYLLDLTPFAIVRESTMIPTERLGGSEWVRLGDMSGFVALDDFSVDGIECTVTEANMIRNYIESGVIV